LDYLIIFTEKWEISVNFSTLFGQAAKEILTIALPLLDNCRKIGYIRNNHSDIDFGNYRKDQVAL
jgi:hypothetical protein